MKNTKITWLASIVLAVIMASGLLAVTAQAQESSWLNVVLDNGLRDIGSGAFDTPDEPKDLRVIVAGIVQVILGILGTIFAVLAVVAGFRWMTAQGNPTNIGKAKQTLYSAVIGLLIVLAAFAVTVFVVRATIGVTQEEGYLDENNIPAND